ncbi:hypothetical protein B5T_03366 [Alloalcanivorax dieselolei B5]|uniref:Uncharacterized protein n=1 Tax=Alcanivorax dieselolei (strain DSM 16502 / CGMCC 1.3690 / MCCC 1A00001 / B-5) TaxID=930169 RepID=K0CG80_ALCDB|nr:hypothetical protein [Alloalcanivorax dieselolei]AFT71633.1 hypothetical protein B5T_03366 [Alloalcanivorax dieselolei B5]GGJ89264.1 hypothetical protein GCM10007426_18170 [Alloalcanivorax dieselolei]
MKARWQATAVLVLCGTVSLTHAAEGDFTPQVIVDFTGASGEFRGMRPEAPPLLADDGRLYGVTFDSGEPGAGDYFVITQGVYYSLDPDAQTPDYQYQLLGSDIGSPLSTVVARSSGSLLVGSSRAVDVDGISSDGQAGWNGIGALAELNGELALQAERIVVPAGFEDADPADMKVRGQMTVDGDDNVYFSSGGRLWRLSADNTLDVLTELQNERFEREGPGNTDYYVLGREVAALVWSESDQALYGVTSGGSAVSAGGDPAEVDAGDPSGTLFRIGADQLSGGDTTDPTLLYTFSYSLHGNPSVSDQGFTGLVEDGDWLYGTTTQLAWRMKKDDPNSFTVIHRFENTDGTAPRGAMVRAADGNIYGTTEFDFSDGEGKGPGTLYRIVMGQAEDRADDTLEFLHTFDAATEGSAPMGLSAGDILTKEDGGQVQRLFGVTQGGATNDEGGIFSVEVPLAAPAITTFAVDPANVTVGDGQAPVLSWSTTGLDGDNVCTIDAGDSADYAALTGEPRAASGSLELAEPGQYGTVTFTLECTAADGETTVGDTAVLTVAQNEGGEDGGDDDNSGGGSSGGGGGGSTGTLVLGLLAAVGLARRRYVRRA